MRACSFFQIPLVAISFVREEAWHRRLRRQRSCAKKIVKVAANLLRGHHGHTIPQGAEQFIEDMSQVGPNEGANSGGIPVAPVIQSFINSSTHMQGDKVEFEQPGSAFALIGTSLGSPALPSGAAGAAALGRQCKGAASVAPPEGTEDSSMAMRVGSDVKLAAVPPIGCEVNAQAPLSATVPLIDLEGEPPCMTEC